MANDFWSWYNNDAYANAASIPMALKNQYDISGPKVSASSNSVIDATDVVLQNLGLGAKPASTNYQRGVSDVTLPSGETISSSGSAATDFLRGIFGVSPLDDSAKDTSGESVAPGSGGFFETSGIGDFVGRITIIILGFIFVAVGLSMFKNPVLEIAKGAVS